MVHDWEYKKLGELCTVLDSQRKPVTKKDRVSGEYPYYGASGIQDYVKDYIFDGDYLLVGEDGAKWDRNEKSAFQIHGKCWVNNHAHILKVNNQLADTSYLEYYLVGKDLNGYITGAVVPKLTQASMVSIPVPVPSIEVQKEICSLLDKLNLLIEKKKEQIAELDNLAQSLFYDMFGVILEAEPTRCLKDVADYYIGLTYSPDDVAQEGCLVLRSSNIQNNKLDFNDIVRVKTTISEKKKVKDGDILMCSRNGSARLVGKVARIRNINEEMSFGAFMTIIRSQYNDFLFHFFLSHYFRNQLTTSKTATINQITTKMLDGIKLNVPPLPLQQEFAKKVYTIEMQKKLINMSIKEVQTLFDAKMDYYFGEDNR